MYSIQISDQKRDPFLERFSFDFIERSGESMEADDTRLFSEAVFAGGKEKLSSVIDQMGKCKSLLDEKISEQDGDSSKEFQPKEYWRNQVWKDLEDEIGNVFGFRSVQIHPLIEKYSSTDKQFESKSLNCLIYHLDRYPIEGLVTDKGFYDKSHSIIMEIYITLGAVKTLTAEELVAVIMHEFGHSIDPAIVDITYTEVNILSKYLTDRKKSINKAEQKMMDKCGGMKTFLGAVGKAVTDLGHKVNFTMNSLLGIFTRKDKLEKKNLEKLKKLLSAEKGDFNRQNYGEAFADNFARMYGLGAQLMSAIKKMSDSEFKNMESRVKKEKKRQQIIMEVMTDMLKDEHKTDIHRVRSLIKEYEEDIKDPNTPEVVKKQLQEDIDEVKKILDSYMNDYDSFRNHVNKMINEELEKLEGYHKDIQAVKWEPMKNTDNKPGEKLTESSVFADDEVFTEKGRIDDNVTKFKKRYNYDPSKKTIVVDGKTYKVDLDINKSTVTYPDGTYARRNTSIIPPSGNEKIPFLVLDKQFFSLKNQERRDAILQHEIGHAMYANNGEKSKASYRDAFNNASSKYTSKEHRHLNTDEFEADQHAVNKTSISAWKRAQRELAKKISKPSFSKEIMKMELGELYAMGIEAGMSKSELKEQMLQMYYQQYVDDFNGSGSPESYDEWKKKNHGKVEAEYAAAARNMLKDNAKMVNDDINVRKKVLNDPEVRKAGRKYE